MSKEKCRNLLYILILAASPLLLILIEYYLNNMSQDLMRFKYESLGNLLIIRVLPLLNGLTIGFFMLLVLVINRKIKEQFKHGLMISILCLAIYPIFYLLSWILFTQSSISALYKGSIPLNGSVDSIVAAIILIIFEFLIFKDKINKSDE